MIFIHFVPHVVQVLDVSLMLLAGLIWPSYSWRQDASLSWRSIIVWRHPLWSKSCIGRFSLGPFFDHSFLSIHIICTCGSISHGRQISSSNAPIAVIWVFAKPLIWLIQFNLLIQWLKKYFTLHFLLDFVWLAKLSTLVYFIYLCKIELLHRLRKWKACSVVIWRILIEK